jgi:hypothetical protein
MDNLERLKHEVRDCHNSMRALFDHAKRGGFTDFETDSAQHKIVYLLHRFRQLFENEVPSDAVPIRERAKMRTAMFNACAELLEMVKGIQEFRSDIEGIRGQIILVNHELTLLHERVHLPFKFEVAVEEPPRA